MSNATPDPTLAACLPAGALEGLRILYEKNRPDRGEEPRKER